TMLRALPFDFRGDSATYNCSDQFMFGPALLVNPVTTPMYYTSGSKPVDDAKRTRPVYLPTGTDWYDFWTDQRYSGGQTIEAVATLDTMPLFVRAGSIVPMGPPRQHVNDLPDAPVELHVYGGGNGRFHLYEDEGDNYNYEAGAFSTIQIHWEDRARCLTLEKRVGQYPGMPEQQKFHIVLHESAKRITKHVSYTGESIEVEF
ncbi:MAG: DUF5110 domain-containing protein, partial [Ardenticatenaceae bacterium]|nr:DUF5110 domain-containing protein [Ardenticatenaceae bacterium]